MEPGTLAYYKWWPTFVGKRHRHKGCRTRHGVSEPLSRWWQASIHRKHVWMTRHRHISARNKAPAQHEGSTATLLRVLCCAIYFHWLLIGATPQLASIRTQEWQRLQVRSACCSCQPLSGTPERLPGAASARAAQRHQQYISAGAECAAAGQPQGRAPPRRSTCRWWSRRRWPPTPPRLQLLWRMQ